MAAPPSVQSADPFVLARSRGDVAWQKGRLSEAAEQYEIALALQDDPVVMGRLGLVRLALRNYVEAAWLLQRALRAPSSGLTKKERARFSDGYSDASPHVCEVDISIDQPGASTTIDNVVRGAGRADFVLFVSAGRHEIRARLDGFSEAVRTIEAPGGCSPRVRVQLHLEPLTFTRYAFSPEFLAPNELLVTRTRARIEHVSESIVPWTLYGAKPQENTLKPRAFTGFFLGGGVMIPFGVTPGVGFGGQIFGGWRSRSWWEVGVEGRLAFTTGVLTEFSPFAAYAWSLAAVPCVHTRIHLFFCGLAQVDGGSLGTPPSWLNAGVGGRVGYEFHLTNKVRLRPSIDFVWHPGTDYRVGKADSWTVSTLSGALPLGVVTFFWTDP